MQNQKGQTLVIVVWAIIALLGFGGWVANIVKLVASDFVLTGMIVARVAGIFVPPLGAVLGFI